MTDDRLPVTVISGFLGAGKTTLFNLLLNSRARQRGAVFVNTMFMINIDMGPVRDLDPFHEAEDAA